MFNFINQIKRNINDFISHHIPLIPIIRNKIHIISFRYMILFISCMLLASLLLFSINKKIIISAIETSNPIEIVFEKDLDENRLNRVIDEIKSIPDITNLNFITSDTLRMEIIYQEPILNEAESEGFSPFRNVAFANIKYSIGNAEKREKTISKIESVEGVNFVILNQLRFNRLDYIVSLTNRIYTIFLIFSVIFLLFSVSLSSHYTLKFSKQEIEFINTAKKIMTNLSIRRVYILEGIFSASVSGILSIVILFIIWIILRLFVNFKFVFFSVHHVLFFILFLNIIFIIINLILYKNHKKDEQGF